jgi:hypothetical protein
VERVVSEAQERVRAQVSLSLRGGEVERIVQEACEESGIRVEELKKRESLQGALQVEDGTGATVGLRVGVTHGRRMTSTGGVHLGNYTGGEPGERKNNPRIASQPRQERPQNEYTLRLPWSETAI